SCSLSRSAGGSSCLSGSARDAGRSRRFPWPSWRGGESRGRRRPSAGRSCESRARRRSTAAADRGGRPPPRFPPSADVPLPGGGSVADPPPQFEERDARNDRQLSCAVLDTQTHEVEVIDYPDARYPV